MESGIVDGVIVVKSKEGAPFNPQVVIARSTGEIIESMQSKYHPVCLNTALRDIDKMDGRFAIVGLPCHIHGIKKYKRYKALEQKIAITIGIFCGINLRFDSLEFLSVRVNEDVSNLNHVLYREGKWPGKTVLQFSNNNRQSVDKNIINHLFTLPRCIYCIDHTSELADISCGDAWLKEVIEKGDEGWSAIISRSSEGQKILENLQKKDKVFLENVPINKIVESQYPMLIFKKKNSWLRMRISEIVGIKVPIYNTQSLCKSVSIRYFFGNIILLFIIHLMKNNKFRKIIMNIPIHIISIIAY